MSKPVASSTKKSAASKNARRASKNVPAVAKNVPAASKNVPAPAKNVPTPAKDVAGAKKNVAGAAKNAGGRAALTDREAAYQEADSQRDPRFKTVDLVAAERSDRVIENEELASTGARTRLRLAHKYRKDLDPALPQVPPFHDHAWSALAALEKAPSAKEPAAPLVRHSPLAALFDNVSTIRNVVELTTRPGDSARDALGFGTPLVLSRSLPKQAAPWVKHARALKERFPALTDALLARTEASLAAADAYVKQARSGEAGAKSGRVDAADTKQLAVDALLNAIDHLRAAARSVLWNDRPKLAAYLFSPLEGTRPGGHAADKGDEPAPTPEPPQK